MHIRNLSIGRLQAMLLEIGCVTGPDSSTACLIKREIARRQARAGNRRLKRPPRAGSSFVDEPPLPHVAQPGVLEGPSTPQAVVPPPQSSALEVPSSAPTDDGAGLDRDKGFSTLSGTQSMKDNDGLLGTQPSHVIHNRILHQNQTANSDDRAADTHSLGERLSPESIMRASTFART